MPYTRFDINSLVGGVGHDSYVFEKGHGQDVVYDVGGTDTIEMQGINYANLQFNGVCTNVNNILP